MVQGATLGFVIGTGRCGSTLVQEVLARHSEVGFVSNLEDKLPLLDLCGRWNNLLLRRAAPRDPRLGPFRDRPRLIERGRLGIAPSEGWEVLERQVSPILVMPDRDLLASDLTPWLDRRLRRFFERRMAAQGRRVLLHHVTGWPRARLWQAAFPQARFIHLVRDGRAVANSWLQTSWWSGYQGPSGWYLGPLPEPYAKEWEAANHCFVLLAGLGWKLLVDAFGAARAAIPASQWLEVRYEDVLADPRGQVTAMLEFLGLGGRPPSKPALPATPSPPAAARPSAATWTPASSPCSSVAWRSTCSATDMRSMTPEAGVEPSRHRPTKARPLPPL